MKANILLIGFIVPFICLGQVKPYPQQLTFTGCIKPSQHSQNTLNNHVSAYYTAWKSNYLRASANTAGAYYIQGENTGGGSSDKGTSEGHGYGMIIMALMAGFDANAKTYFDGLYKMYDNHRSSIDSDLMGWLIDANESTSGTYSSATDGDLDIAYALLLAHYQWGSSGSINYLAQAIRMINAIKNSNINSSNRTNLGDWDNNNFNTRPSDWMFDHFKAFQCATGDNTWNTVHSTLSAAMNTIQTNYSPISGLLPDFVVGSSPAPATAYFLEGPYDGHYYYNACRTPLRIVMDYAHYGTASAKTAVNKMITWAKGSAVSNNNPANFNAGYYLNGNNLPGNNYDDAVFIAPMVAAATCDAAHQTFLNSGWDIIRGLQVNYFSDTYNLLSMLYISGNWWPPYNCGTTLALTFNDHLNEDLPSQQNLLTLHRLESGMLELENTTKESLLVGLYLTQGTLYSSVLLQAGERTPWILPAQTSLLFLKIQGKNGEQIHRILAH
ncbi:MAG: glycosyl hydrolase family 8 [Cytophagaceae bacterium]|jgi:endoglucanase|nr:glycosyl hydrolase family 8 [Cytophagaceae bacterium]